jgi:predicted PurR-regulated permease PerM
MEDEAVAIAEELVPTPIYISQRTRLILIAAAVIAVIWLFSMAPSVPRLLVIGATVALILSFPVRLLQRWMPRGVAILVVVSSTILMAVIGVAILIPFAINEISGFVEQMPEIADSLEQQARDVLMEFYRRGWMDQHPDTVIENVQGNLLERGEEIASTLLTNAVETLTRSFSIAITTFGVIFVATYLLIDIPRFKEKFVLSFSPAYRLDAAQLWTTVGESLSRYLAGLMISILIQGAMATIGLTLIGVPYAIVLGVWMSATAILPYVGAFLGAIPAILVALTISWESALLVAGLYILINQVEGNFITPKIQGTAVRVHPLLIFVSVIGGTQIAGFLGAVLAVPTLAVVRVLTEFLWDRLRVRHAHDTVLVALGGEDDGAEAWTEEDEALATATTAGEDGSDVDIRTGDDEDDETSVHAESRKPVPDGHVETPVAAGYRAKPTVRRRAIRRTHTRPRIASGSPTREPVRSHT